MADEPENAALAMLLRLEARVESLAAELLRVKGRLAHVESRLARLETECGALVAPGARTPRAIPPVLPDLAEVAPPLSTGEDEDAFAELVRRIRGRRTAVHVLTDEEQTALEAALRNGVASPEEVAAFRKRRGLE